MNYDDNLSYGFNHGNTKSAEKLLLNKYECERLLKSILYDNFNVLDNEPASNDLIKRSWLYRICKSYKYFHQNKVARRVKSFNCQDLSNFLFKIKDLAPLELYKYSPKDHDKFSFNDMFLNGLIFESDYEELLKFCDGQIVIEIQTMAIINGRRFSSRGCEYRQTEYSSIAKPTVNAINLKDNWSESKSLSSWFKFNKDLFITYKELLHKGEEFASHFSYDYMKPIDLYGQFNFFFKLDNNDTLINSKLYASVIMRKTMDLNNSQVNYMIKTIHSNGIQHIPVIQMKNEIANKCCIHNMIFVSENLVHSSPILVLPIYVDNDTWSEIKAIKPEGKDTGKIFTDDAYKTFYERDISKTTHLIMIDLERNRMTSAVTNPEGWGFMD
jgi:hypothetical protein